MPVSVHLRPRRLRHAVRCRSRSLPRRVRCGDCSSFSLAGWQPRGVAARQASLPGRLDQASQRVCLIAPNRALASQKIAAQADGQPCCDWVGDDGAGHYVKMVSARVWTDGVSSRQGFESLDLREPGGGRVWQLAHVWVRHPRPVFRLLAFIAPLRIVMQVHNGIEYGDIQMICEAYQVRARSCTCAEKPASSFRFCVALRVEGW